MSQPDFNKTLNSLYSAMTEIKHLRTELEAKKAIIAQLNSKIAVLESSKGSAVQAVQSHLDRPSRRFASRNVVRTVRTILQLSG